MYTSQIGLNLLDDFTPSDVAKNYLLLMSQAVWNVQQCRLWLSDPWIQFYKIRNSSAQVKCFKISSLEY